MSPLQIVGAVLLGIGVAAALFYASAAITGVTTAWWQTRAIRAQTRRYRRASKAIRKVQEHE